MVCIENYMMNYLLLPLNCEQGKCPSLTFTITWIDNFAKSLSPCPCRVWSFGEVYLCLLIYILKFCIYPIPSYRIFGGG
jgi:hypothetical protein